MGLLAEVARKRDSPGLDKLLPDPEKSIFNFMIAMLTKPIKNIAKGVILLGFESGNIGLIHLNDEKSTFFV